MLSDQLYARWAITGSWEPLVQNCIRWPRPPTKMAAIAELSLILDPMGNSLKNLLIWNYLLNLNQTLLKWSLDGPLTELYKKKNLRTNQDGRHSQTLFNIGPYGKFIKKSSCLELLVQLEPNFGWMVIRWSSFRIASDDPTGQPRWLPQPNLV